MHLIIDGYGGDPAKLAAEEVVKGLLESYPEAIGMTKLAPPQVYRYQGAKPLDWGLSGFVIIAESHISIHTFPARRLLWADIFSCRPFDAERAIEAVKEHFALTEVRTTILERGLEHPSPVAEALAADEGRPGP